MTNMEYDGLTSNNLLPCWKFSSLKLSNNDNFPLALTYYVTLYPGLYSKLMVSIILGIGQGTQIG